MVNLKGIYSNSQELKGQQLRVATSCDLEMRYIPLDISVVSVDCQGKISYGGHWVLWGTIFIPNHSIPYSGDAITGNTNTQGTGEVEHIEVDLTTF